MIFYAFQQFHTYAFIQASKVGKGVKKKKEKQQQQKHSPKRSGDLHKHRSMAVPRLEPRCSVS